jgi:prepilin-type N-terminal cleavage/methylation domain-containing protein
MKYLVSAKTQSNIRRKSGVTLVEILIVSTIIALMAAISFPVYKIIQQRDKERRLESILRDVRAALSGYQGNAYGARRKRIKHFVEGYRSYILERGIAQIEEAYAPDTPPNAVIKDFITEARKNGLFYPETIWHLTAAHIPYTVEIATLSPPSDTFANVPGEYVQITVDHPFIRNIPPHPFKDWYPNARWEFRFLNPPGPETTGIDGTGNYVIEIYSRGAGTALDGRSTDDF